MRTASGYGNLYEEQCQLEISMRVVLFIQFILAFIIIALAIWNLPVEKKRHQNLLRSSESTRRIFEEMFEENEFE